MGSISISLQDFRDLLYNSDVSILDRYWEEGVNGGERVFYYSVGEGFVLEILTSIPRDEYYSRSEGDAIRTQIRHQETGKILDAEAHTKRTEGWEDRVAEKVESLVGCPEEECTGEKRIADGQYGRYYFCIEDTCNFSQSISKE